jgi:transcriptional regulator with XRE-family HTH domain
MDQWSLGEAIGKSASWVSLLEHGRVKPDPATAAKLAKTLRIDLADLQDALEGVEHD